MRSYVRLTLPVDADTPEEAVARFIQQIVEDGLTSWIYRVEQDGTAVFINGKGERYDIAELAHGIVQNGNDDESLLEIARELTTGQT